MAANPILPFQAPPVGRTSVLLLVCKKIEVHSVEALGHEEQKTKMSVSTRTGQHEFPQVFAEGQFLQRTYWLCLRNGTLFKVILLL